MVRVLTVQGAIRPASADYLLHGLAGAAADKAHPVTIYVSPKGARTASAGTCIRWLAELRGRNADWVERAVREAARQGDPCRRRIAGLGKAAGRRREPRRPQAMQLRYPQTLSNIAGDRSNTIVFPMLDELMNLTMRGGKSGDQRRRAKTISTVRPGWQACRHRGMLTHRPDSGTGPAPSGPM